MDIGLADDRDLHAGAIDAGGIESRDVVDRRDVVRSQIIVTEPIAILRGRLRRLSYHHGFGSEVFQAAEAVDDALQSFRDGWVCGVRESVFAIDHEMMHLDVECLFDLSNGAAERDPIACASDLDDGEALPAKPLLNFGNVRTAQAKAVAILFRCEPLVVFLGSRVLLIGRQLLARRLLSSRWLDQQSYV